MKRKFFLALVASVAVSALCAQNRSAGFYVTSPVAVRMPLQGDSINFKGNRFTVRELLKSPVTTDFSRLEYTTISADTSGYVTVPRARENYLFYLFSTNVRAERFMYANLKVYSTTRFEVFVNGESMLTSTSSVESASKITPSSVSLRMEPQKDYNVVIKLMPGAEDKADPMLKCELEKKEQYKDVECFMAPDLKRRMSLYETTYGAKTVTLSLSPSGKYLLFGTTDSYSVKYSSSTCEIKDAVTMETIASDLPGLAKWMPASDCIYYMENGEKGKDLVTFDPQTRKETILKKNIPDGTFHWSPDEDYLIYVKSDINPKDGGALRRYLMPDDRLPGGRNRNYLEKYDLASGLQERLTYGSRSVRLADISPCGKKLLCIIDKPNITERPFNLYSLMELDLETLKADTLIKDEPFFKNACYSPNGSQLLLVASAEAFSGIGKNCGNHPIANDYDNQAYIMDKRTLKITPITRNFNPSVEILQWNRGDGNIYFTTTDEDCRNIYRYLPGRGKFEKLNLEEDAITSFSLPHRNPSMAAYIGGGCASTGVGYLYDVKKKRSEKVSDPMAQRYHNLQFGQMEEWYFTSSDGTRIKGLKCLPPDFDPQKKYPLIVYYYGGTTPTTRSMTTPYAPQLFASRDYVVYVIQPSGAIGFGQEFSARHVNAWGERTADDIIEGTKQFCKEHPFVDAEKIGCLGASYGGFMTQYLQTRTDIFAAAISHAGISNVASYWGEGYWGYSYNSTAAAGSYPWNNPELFTSHGSLFNADKINTPLLLLHGTRDTNVPIGESVQLFNALKILGKEVEFISVDGEDHYIADYSYRLKWHDTIMAWFAKWLQDSPQWWDELYPKRNW
jgi:dipeptidyl aminopeptidase/acylaminoacyl peptidase